MNYSIHSSSLCESVHVGSDTRIGAFSHVQAGARIGTACSIGDHVLVEPDVVLGDRVKVESGVQLRNGLRVGNGVEIGSNVTFCSQIDGPATTLSEGASIGGGATLHPGLTIGVNARVEPGSVVLRSVPAETVVVGNPARIVGYTGAHRKSHPPFVDSAKPGDVRSGGVKGVTLHKLPLVRDLRGDLSAGEFEQNVPFRPKRYFLVFDVPSAEIRGEHAHKECQQFLICVRGSCSVLVTDGKTTEEFPLAQPNLGLYLPPMVWGVQHKYSADAVLLVFASHHYDPNDYIRDYDAFRRLLGSE